MRLHSMYEFKSGFEIFLKNFIHNSTDIKDDYHFHDEYEIFLVLSGYIQYNVEGEVLSLGPKDCVIISPNTFHGKTSIKSDNVTYTTIYIGEEFFSTNNCLDYKNIFLKSQEKLQYKITKEVCENSGFYNAYERLKKYSDDFENLDKQIATNTISEMLYI